MKTQMKRTIGLAVLAIAVIILLSNNYRHKVVENDFIRALKKKIALFNGYLPEDRIYCQFDKPFYKPGETIWFSAYIRNGSGLKPSVKSDILHVELISPKGTTEKKIKLIAKNGKASGDFSIDKEASGGIYTVKAYTNWQKNEGEAVFFEKKLQVQHVVLPNLKMQLDFERKAFGPGDEVIAKISLNTNENKALQHHALRFTANLDGKKFIEESSVTDYQGERRIRFRLPEQLNTTDGLLNILIDFEGQTESISRSIPIILNNIDLTLYPEGGDLVDGLQSQVAFRAINEFGKPADVEGVVLNQDGRTISTFKSYHQGMGAFLFTPVSGQEYLVKITKPKGIDKEYKMPEPMRRGYVLNIKHATPEELTLKVKTTETEQVSLVAQVRGKVYYSTAFDITAGSNTLNISTEQFPSGVAQFTLFDKKGIQRAERLVFVNKDRQLKVDIETDKEQYQPREKVIMTIRVEDERGLPMPAHLSLSVVDDQLLTFADDKSGNILSMLLLEYDIKQKVEEPAFYFDKEEEKADQALDHLMMTAGWRRYTWVRVMDEDLPAIAYDGEKAVIAGVVLDAYSGQPIPNAKIKINSAKGGFTANSEGEFSINGLDLSEPTNLFLTAQGYSQTNYVVGDYLQNLTYYLYKPYKQNYWYKSASRSKHKRSFPAQAIGGGNDIDLIPEQEEMMLVEDAMVAEKAVMLEAVVAKDGEVKSGEPEDEQEFKVVMADERDRRILGKTSKKELVGNIQGNVALYYRARQFESPQYTDQAVPEIRNDFRSTIYWNGNIDIDRSGKKVVEFYNSDNITSFKAIAEGIGADGMVGRAEKTFFTQLPFALKVKVPVEVATTDIVSIPLTIKNNTPKEISGFLGIQSPNGLKALNTVAKLHTLKPGETKLVYLDYEVLNEIGEGNFNISFKACGLSDAFSKNIRIVAKGFPVTTSYSGEAKDARYYVDLNNVVKGSITATLTAYPSVVGDLLTGVEGILREPSGCFEQTSTSSYPNAMVLDYLQTTGNEDSKLLASAMEFLDRGYKRLTTFETSEKGYEWFGKAPGHEGLTAYGLMQFRDMQKVGGDVDQEMIDRTAKWIMSRKDGKGGFLRNTYALHNYGMISDDIMNGYIVYALAEGGYKDIEKEAAAAYKKARESKDPYQLSMSANALRILGDEKNADDALKALYAMQKEDGSFVGKTHSITHSTGKSLTIETTSLAAMAIMKSEAGNKMVLNKAIEFIVNSRSGYGTFGNTQGTILALKTLTEYAKSSKKAKEDGTIEFYVDGKKVAEKAYKAGEQEAIVLDGLGKFIKSGKHKLRIKYVGVSNPLPYSLAVSWNTFLPESDEACSVELKTSLSAKTVSVGETVRLVTSVTNKTNKGLPSTIAIIGIPAGLTAQPWQLKELQEKEIVAYYEVIGNNVVVYYRGMAPAETREINLDLKAEMPGEYDAPASSAYLYYTNEFKSWNAVDRIKIKKQS